MIIGMDAWCDSIRFSSRVHGFEGLGFYFFFLSMAEIESILKDRDRKGGFLDLDFYTDGADVVDR